MAATRNQPWLLLLLFYFVSVVHFSYCQSFSNQNIETFYPFPIQTPSPPPSPGIFNDPPNSTRFSPPPVFPPSPEPNPSSDRTLVKAIAATAASTFVVATLLFFFVRRFFIARRKERSNTDTIGAPPVAFNDQFERVNGNLKGMIVDENGLDVLYWRKLEGEKKKKMTNGTVIKINSSRRERQFHRPGDEEKEEEDGVRSRKERRKSSEAPIQEIPLLAPETDNIPSPPTVQIETADVEIAGEGIQQQNLSSTPPPPPPPPPPPVAQPLMAIPKKQGPAPPPPPPPPVPEKKNMAPPTPVPGKKNPAAPPPPPLLKGDRSGSKTGEDSAGEDTTGTGNGQVKLKPLHWDKVNKNNTQNSMVWDKIDGGSFRFDDNLMEALFGYVATNRKSPQRDNLAIPESPNSSPPSSLFDARKSQNIAIVIKSLGISHQEIIDALTDGQGLDSDTLEKLMRIAPSEEEQSQILEFDGDPTKLADAERFLYHLLKAVPSAFTRLNAMLFRSNYDTEVLHFKGSLQTLELGCHELRNRGLFMKLLEVILKAGNRMNAGTSRGNAQAFKLTSLRKLSDVKSTDGKTTLLHFVVEEVVRSEGKRCVLNRNRSLNRSSSNRSVNTENSASKEEREKEYKMLGLPMVGGLSSEFSNVKKAAQIDYDAFSGTFASLTARATEAKLILSQCSKDGEDGFSRVMKDFLGAVEEDLKALEEEQARIMDLVKKTTDYYQAASSNDRGANLLQLFVIIKEFLDMVDQVCVDITRNLQRKKTPASSGFASPKSPETRRTVRFPNLPEHFLKEKSRSSSSESDTDL